MITKNVLLMAFIGALSLTACGGNQTNPIPPAATKGALHSLELEDDYVITDWVESYDTDQPSPYLNVIDKNEEFFADEFDNQPGVSEPCAPDDECVDPESEAPQSTLNAAFLKPLFMQFGPRPVANGIVVESSNVGRGGAEQYAAEMRNMTSTPQNFSRSVTATGSVSVSGGFNVGVINATLGQGSSTFTTNVSVTVPARSTYRVFTYITGVYTSGYQLGPSGTKSRFTHFRPTGIGYRIS